MSKLTREVKQRKFRTPQAKNKIIHKLIDEVEALERKLKRPAILPNFGIKWNPMTTIEDAIRRDKSVSKKSYYKEGGTE